MTRAAGRLPDEVDKRLIRAISAFMKATPAAELPAPLKPLRNFTTRALASHKQKLFSAFEDDAFAARVAEWLEKSPPRSLGAEDAQLLDLFARRPEGWERRLSEARVGPARAQPKRAPDGETQRLLARERERARKAEERERRAREAERAAVREGAAKTEALGRELEGLKEELESARDDAARLRAEAQLAARRYEQEQRKRIKTVEQARQEREKLRGEVKAARREVRELQAERARLERALARAGQRRKDATSSRRSETRRPLPVPKGRPGDDRETLDEWLDAPGVHLLVDGYNVTKAEGGFGDLDLEAQRLRLTDGITRVALKKRIPATVVFDGSTASTPIVRKRSSPVSVEYSKPPENADDHLIARLHSLGPTPVVVATDDRELQQRAEDQGATIATARQLLELIR